MCQELKEVFVPQPTCRTCRTVPDEGHYLPDGCRTGRMRLWCIRWPVRLTIYIGVWLGFELDHSPHTKEIHELS